MPPGEKQKEFHALRAPVFPTSNSAVTARRPQGRTIEDVPVELLLEIFRIHAASCRDTSSPTAWMGILLVCKYWHRVACDASELWRVIHVGSNTDWLQLCLKRSARSLVDLHFYGLPTATVEAAVPLVVPHALRIRAVHLTGHGHLSPKICSLFARKLHALEELSILPAEWRATRELKVVPWEQGYRGLHSLALSGVSIPREPAFYRKMRRLELHERCCNNSQFTIDDLVLALDAAASTLEELELSRFSPIVPADPQSPPKPLPNVSLKRLRGFYVDGDFSVVPHLNKHLTLPRGAFLHMRVWLGHADQLRYANGAAVLADIVPPGVRHILESATDMLVSIDRESYAIRIHNFPSSGHTPHILDGPPIDRVRINTFGWMPDRTPGLRGLSTVYTSGLLTSLSITLRGQEFPLTEWRTLFIAFRLLERLAIVDHTHLNPSSAFVALSAPNDPVLTRAARGDDPTRSVMCPALRALHLEGMVHKYEVESVFEALRSALLSRAQLELRLEELCVECVASSNVTLDELGGQVASLRPLVGSLVLL